MIWGSRTVGGGNDNGREGELAAASKQIVADPMGLAVNSYAMHLRTLALGGRKGKLHPSASPLGQGVNCTNLPCFLCINEERVPR